MEEQDKKEVVPETKDENIEVKEVTVNEVKPKKQRKPLTPEYKALLVERIANARKVKRKAHDIGVTPPRIIAPDKGEAKRFYCDSCRKSYASQSSLKKHNRRFHAEKQLANIIKEKEMQNEKEAKPDEAKPVEQPKPVEQAKPVEQPKPVEQAKPVEQPKAIPKPIPIPQIQTPPPPRPVIERTPVYTGPKRYTYEEFKQIENQNKIKKQQKEKELKAQAKQNHILKTIANMKQGGIPTFNY